jgi:pseudouridylate synthase / pseudouridine kinase
VIFRKPVKLGLFPKHSINVITPNILELKAMYNAAQENGLFEGSEWWSILDSFKVTSQFRQGSELLDHAEIDVEILLRKITPGKDSSVVDSKGGNIDPPLPGLIIEGSVQQAMSLLPYIPNVLIKLGPQGILCVRLFPKDAAINDTDNTLRLRGAHVDVIVRYFPGLKTQGIVSVTGAGFPPFTNKLT